MADRDDEKAAVSGAAQTDFTMNDTAKAILQSIPPGMPILLGRYDDEPIETQRWLRNEFCFQRKPIDRPNDPDNGLYIGMDNAHAEGRDSESLSDHAVLVMVSERLMQQIIAAAGQP